MRNSSSSSSSSYWLFRLIQDISLATVFFHSFRSKSFSVNSSTVLFIGFRSLFICFIHVCFGFPRLPFAFFKCSLNTYFAGVLSGSLSMCPSQFSRHFFISVVMGIWCDLLYISSFLILSVNLMFSILRSSFLRKLSRHSSNFLVKVQISQLQRSIGYMNVFSILNFSFMDVCLLQRILSYLLKASIDIPFLLFMSFSVSKKIPIYFMVFHSSLPSVPAQNSSVFSVLTFRFLDMRKEVLNSSCKSASHNCDKQHNREEDCLQT